ncbi:MAG: hypothetical protein ACODAJ_00775 [Planctomycetota bacterium]
MTVDERVAEAVRAAAEDGRLACAEALAIAERLEVEPRAVGEAANRLGIKIVACQLGCFGGGAKR